MNGPVKAPQAANAGTKHTPEGDHPRGGDARIAQDYVPTRAQERARFKDDVSRVRKIFPREICRFIRGERQVEITLKELEKLVFQMNPNPDDRSGGPMAGIRMAVDAGRMAYQGHIDGAHQFIWTGGSGRGSRRTEAVSW